VLGTWMLLDQGWMRLGNLPWSGCFYCTLDVSKLWRVCLCNNFLGRRVRGGSGGGERRWLLVPGSEQFSHCFLMASQDSLGTRHLRCLTSIFAGPKCLALWGSPILVGGGHAFAWNRGIEDEHSREQKERHLGLKCGGWANGGRPARFTSTLHLA
jgi:hypothetical protein